MKEARAGVDGRDFEKMVSVEEEEGFLAREEEFFPRGRPRMREAKMLRLLRNLLRCYTEHADERADQACVQASLRANFSIRDEFSSALIHVIIVISAMHLGFGNY